MNIIEIKGLNKHFGSLSALDDVNLAIEKGSVVGLLGPNGAGKTTLLRILNGILVKDSGEVLINGEEASLSAARKIGYMPEERGLYENMTVENQIIYFGQLKGAEKSEIRDIMNEYLELFNLKGSNKRKVKELSKGNQQKIQIISTLVHRPEIVILDEPFSGFDPINGAILQELIDRLKAQGTTVIISSHNMHAVEAMCDSIILINKGSLILQGNIDIIKQYYKKGEYRVACNSRLELNMLGETGKIEWIKQIPQIKGVPGIAYNFKKSEGINNISILDEISKQTEITLFEEVLPSLNDIFISIIKSTGSNAANK